MRWATGIVLRRAATQRTVLAAVLVVAIAGAGLIGAFTLLFSASDGRAVAADLARRPMSELELEAVLSVGAHDGEAALDDATAALESTVGDVAATRHEWLASTDYRHPSPTPGALDIAVVLGSLDSPADGARLVEGAWPQDGAADRVEVAIPLVAADELGWSLGDVVPLRAYTSSSAVDVVVVGVYEPLPAAQFWSRDPFAGTSVNRAYPVPGSWGYAVTVAYGPLLATPTAMRAPQLVLDTAHVVLRPDVVAADPSALDGLRARLDDARVELAKSMTTSAQSATFASRLATSLDSARAGLAVTRVALIVLSLMLLALTASVLQLSARLLTERRTGEEALLTSRGASRAQLVGLGVLEAAGVAAVTAATAPWLARGVYRILAEESSFAAAGLPADQGTPALLWLACAGAALLFAAVLVAPLLRRTTSVVDAEQGEVRQDRRTMMTRSGIDVALVALAVVAYLQLRQYRSPVLRSGGVDPVLVVGPALFLLAGAAIALRLLPLAAAAAERRAGRSRSLAAPLAAWEIGRRPRRATGAVLVLTLAIAVGAFAQSFQATWALSQTEQAAAQVGTDVRVDRLPLGPFEQSSVIAGLGGVAAASPVASRSVSLGSRVDMGSLDGKASTVHLLAIDAAQAPALVRGREDPSQWEDLLRPDNVESPVGAPLPPGTTGFAVTVTGVADPEMGPVGLRLRVLVQDAHGVIATRGPDNLVPLDGTPQDVTITLADDGARLAEPLAVIGAGGQLFARSELDYDFAASIPQGTAFEIELSAPRGIGQDGAEAPATFDGGEWSARTRPDPFGSTAGIAVSGGQGGQPLIVREEGDDLPSGFGDAGFVATVLADSGAVPAIASAHLLDELGLEVGDSAALMVGGMLVRAEIVRAVPDLPSVPGRDAVLMDRTTLTHALARSGFDEDLVDEWWLEVADPDAGAVLDEVREGHGGSAVSRVHVEEDLAHGPLRVAVTAALRLISLAAVALAIVGLTMSATVSVRQRRLELARLQALGAARATLVRSVVVEHALLIALGVAAGGALGGFLARLVAPLLTLGADGRPPRPAAQLVWDWPSQGVLLLGVVVLTGAAITLTASALMRRASAELLRLGDDR